MQSQNLKPEDKLSRQALQIFGAGSLVVYILALCYCYSTARYQELKLMSVATAGLFILFLSTYYSIGKEPPERLQHPEIEDRRREAA